MEDLTQVKCNDFHSVKRELYAILVYDLWRDPIEAIQMMAIWIWLERITMKSPDLTRKILTLSTHLIDKVGNEALFCWACVDNLGLLFSSSVADFPLTNILLKKDMPVEFFRKHREVTVAGINEVIICVCATCLKDIWDGTIARNNGHVDSLQMVAKFVSETQNVARMDSSQLVANVATETRRVEIQPDERTLFVTFSRGYPVAESEVREFFTRLFGDCIESLYIQEVGIGEHPLYAKMVLHHTSYIHMVLIGGTKAKFIINGKQVWMRKFIPNRR